MFPLNLTTKKQALLHHQHLSAPKICSDGYSHDTDLSCKKSIQKIKPLWRYFMQKKSNSMTDGENFDTKTQEPDF